jgi:Ca-activated chloride channel family protein
MSQEIEDSAIVDGCSAMGILWHIALPLAKPAIGVVAIFNALAVWNEYILAMIILALFFRKGSVFPMIILLLPIASGATEAKKDDLEYLKFDNIFSLDVFRNEDQKAYNRFKKGKYDEAYEKFSSDYNKGVAAYKLKDFGKAEEYFLKDNSLDSLYNLGNAQISQLKAKEAIETYGKVIKQDPANSDAKFNLELAKKLLNEQNRQQNKQLEQNKNNQPQTQQENQQNPEMQNQDKKDGDDKNKEGESKGKNSDDFKNAEVNPVSSGSFGDKTIDKNFNNQLKIDAQKIIFEMHT